MNKVRREREVSTTEEKIGNFMSEFQKEAKLARKVEISMKINTHEEINMFLKPTKTTKFSSNIN